MEKPKVKVFDLNDSSLKELGHVLSSPTARKIITVLVENEMYINELAKKIDTSSNLTSHHLEKLVKIGIVSITNKPISRKHKDHKYYKINMDIFISIKQNKTDGSKLKRIFKDTIKFASIGIAGLMMWGFTSISSNGTLSDDVKPLLDLPDIANSDSLVYALLVMFGLIIGSYLFSKFKNKKRGF